MCGSIWAKTDGNDKMVIRRRLGLNRVGGGSRNGKDNGSSDCYATTL
jgi:hypothetical protein